MRIKMSGSIIGLQPIFIDLDFWPKRASRKNGITFQAVKWDRLIFVKNVSGKKFLEFYDQYFSMLIFGQKGRVTKTELLFQAIKWERLIFTKKVSDKMLML